MIYIASDHAGFELKSRIVRFLRDAGRDVEDLGPDSEDANDDYPDLIRPLAEKVAADRGTIGIAIGASGEGEAIVANRVRGARAAVYYGGNATQRDASGNTLTIVQSARAHNHANILSLGARFITEEEAKEAVRLFLDTPVSTDERHVRRVAKIDEN
jgi:ribose 5-phosphate isomerase B